MTDEKKKPPDLAALEEISVMLAEMRQFNSRVMTGYESAHRTIADLCQSMSTRAEKAEAIAVKSFEMQMRLAEEREELLSRKHKRELESLEAKAQLETVNQLKRDGIGLGKLIIKKLTGIPLDAEGSGLDDLLNTFSEEQFDGLMTTGTVTLSAAQRQVIVALVQENAAAKAKKELPEAAE